MNELLNDIKNKCLQILKEKMVGIYVHGSIAFGCFRFETSDIDFIIVVNHPLTLHEKKEIIQYFLDISSICPPKGIEMSVVLEQVCSSFIYPTPYELHYSNSHYEKCIENLEEYCKCEKTVDKDLAAHFTVIHHSGIVLYGKEISKVFGTVAKEDYVDSICDDIFNAHEDIKKDPVYIILNLCRVLAYLKEEKVLSKKDGGDWGMRNLDRKYNDLIKNALLSYVDGNEYHHSKLELDFVTFMKDQIFNKSLQEKD